MLFQKNTYLQIFLNTLWLCENSLGPILYIAFIFILVGTKTWRGVFKSFVPVGLCLIAVMQWRAYRRYKLGKVASHWEINLYCALPLRSLSRGWGWIAGNI